MCALSGMLVKRNVCTQRYAYKKKLLRYSYNWDCYSPLLKLGVILIRMELRAMIIRVGYRTTHFCILDLFYKPMTCLYYYLALHFINTTLVIKHFQLIYKLSTRILYFRFSIFPVIRYRKNDINPLNLKVSNNLIKALWLHGTEWFSMWECTRIQLKKNLFIGFHTTYESPQVHLDLFYLRQPSLCIISYFLIFCGSLQAVSKALNVIVLRLRMK